MKKLKFIILLFILIVCPIIIKASTTSISSVSVVGTDSAKVGSEFSQGFKVVFSDLYKGSTETLGIWLVKYEIDYNEDDFIIKSISSGGNTWSSVVYKEGGKTYVLSQFANDPYHNACVDGVLYCAEYYSSITFYVKDTNNKTSKITMKDVEVGAFQVSGSLNPEYDVNDMIELDSSSTASNTIKITKPENVKVEEPKSIINNSKPSVKKPVTTSNNSSKNSISDNNNLKTLEIEGYSIDFSKDKKKYTVKVKEDVNSLKINAKAEDKKATVKISGNKDLNANDNKVLIKVTAENGKTKTYTINIKRVKKIIINDIEKNIEKKRFKITKNHIKYGGIIIGALLILIIVIRLIIKIKDRKVDKMFDSM